MKHILIFIAVVAVIISIAVLWIVAKIILYVAGIVCIIVFAAITIWEVIKSSQK
jgi:hypothetical protein